MRDPHEDDTEVALNIIERYHTVAFYPDTLLPKLIALAAIVVMVASIVLFFAGLVAYDSMTVTIAIPDMYMPIVECFAIAIACEFAMAVLTLCAVLALLFHY